MNNKTKYIVYPGRIVSKRHASTYYVQASNIVRAYGVRWMECHLWDPNDPNTYTGLDPERVKACIWLFPRDDDRYMIPEKPQGFTEPPY